VQLSPFAAPFPVGEGEEGDAWWEISREALERRINAFNCNNQGLLIELVDYSATSL